MSSGFEASSANRDVDQVSLAPVILERMPQQARILVTEDDWTGTSNPAARRRLQNRINQRHYRKRRAVQEKRDGSHNSSMNTAAVSSRSTEHDTPRVESHFDVDTDHTLQENKLWYLFHSAVTNLKRDFSELEQVAAICPADCKTTVSLFEQWASSRMMGSPTADHVLVLVKFNVFRALSTNTKSLGFSIEENAFDDALSPFSDPSRAVIPSSVLPPALRPTEIQRRIPHHPWLDSLPLPEMRDKLILAQDDMDDMALCEDLVGHFGGPQERDGMIVWGEPYDVSAWEVSEDFLKNWGWTIKGCSQIIQSTNYWRARRHERPLDFSRLSQEPE